MRGLLLMEVPDFEARFARAVDDLARDDAPDGAIAEMERFAELQPEFWPALFFMALGYKRLGDADAALDTLAEALAVSPAQAEVLNEMAELFDQRGNPKRALECVEQAIESQPEQPNLHAAMARYCERLGRTEAARAAAALALELDPESVEYRALRDRLSDDSA